jgi:hypothetical protein
MAEINLEEQIKLLVELQGLDTKIFGLERELQEIPEEIKRLEERFNETTASVKELESKVKMLQLKRKEKELDLETREGSIKKLQSQLYQVKTNKEYSAMQQEIGRAKADKSNIEDDIIRLLDEIDAENKKLSQGKEALKVEESAMNQEKRRLQALTTEKESQLAALRDRRKVRAEKVDEGMLTKYERILRSKHGLAMTAVRGDACQGCFRVMPAQVINEIRMKQELVFCGNCARILYIEE